MKYFFYLLSCFLSCLIFFSSNSHDARINTTTKIGDFAADFSLKDIAGNTVKLSAFKGKTDITRHHIVRSIPVSFFTDKKGGIANAYTGLTDDLNNEISPQIEKII